MTGPTPAFSGKKKFLEATVTLTLPKIDADPQVWDSYDLEQMAKNYKSELVHNLIEQIEGPFEDDILGITAEVNIVSED